MNILEKSKMKDGTKIQIEDWHDEYNFMEKGSTLVAYPKSKMNMEGEYSPKLNRTFRASFNFDNAKDTMEAFKGLKHGIKRLSDFKEYMNNPKNNECI